MPVLHLTDRTIAALPSPLRASVNGITGTTSCKTQGCNRDERQSSMALASLSADGRTRTVTFSVRGARDDRRDSPRSTDVSNFIVLTA